ncbi:MAG: tyrosine-type recombinase/integrase [Enterocloster sp.]
MCTALLWRKCRALHFRHTFCSRCFEADMQPKVVQSIMGHQHYSTTIDIYTHVTDEKYQEEIGKFGRAMEPDVQEDTVENVGMLQVLQ